MEAGGVRRRRSPMEIAAFFTAATAAAEAVVAITRNWIFYFCMRTVVFGGGLLALFIGYVMAAYSKTWLDSLSLLPLLFAAVILPVYAAVAIQNARRLERERVVWMVRKALEIEGL
uniref:Uncharacterized protein n=1 Tax=Oryza glumipatula TaxID=40148 RepID=A0A0E0AG76_9ORYZ